MKRLNVVVGLLGIAWGCFADEGVRGPVTGYVFDPQQAAIRPIEGLPGAARLGAGFAQDKALAECEVSSPEKIALCRAAAYESWVVLAWAGGEVQVREIAGVTGSAERTLFSQGGRRAVIHLASEGDVDGLLVWLRDMPNEPAVDASHKTGKGWRLLDVEPTGDRVLMTNGRELRLLAATSSSQWLASGENITAATFSGDGGVYFADQGTKEVWKLQQAEAGSVALRVMSAADGVEKPVAVGTCATADGEQMVMVDRDAARLEILRPFSQRVDRLPVWGPPSRMARLNRDGLYVLNQAGKRPLLMFDCAAGAAYFVPVD